MFIYITAGLAAAGCTSGFAFPGPVTQLASFGGALAFIAVACSALFYLLRSWKPAPLLAALPFVATVVLAGLPFLVARPIARCWFNFFRLERYQAAASWVSAQTVPIDEPVNDPEWTPPFIDLPPQHAPLAYTTEAHRHRDGSLIVVFVYSGAFPVKHFAYMYSSSGEWDHHLDHRWRGLPIASQWFAVVD